VKKIFRPLMLRNLVRLAADSNLCQHGAFLVLYDDSYFGNRLISDLTHASLASSGMDESL